MSCVCDRRWSLCPIGLSSRERARLEVVVAEVAEVQAASEAV